MVLNKHSCLRNKNRRSQDKTQSYGRAVSPSILLLGGLDKFKNNLLYLSLGWFPADKPISLLVQTPVASTFPFWQGILL